MSKKFAVTALSAVLAVTSAAYADETNRRAEARKPPAAYTLTQPLHGATLWFADRYASAYYTVDDDTFEVVTTIAEGPAGGNPMQSRARLSDGETATVSIGGYGNNRLLTTLNLTRVGDEIMVHVDTEPALSAQAVSQ